MSVDFVWVPYSMYNWRKGCQPTVPILCEDMMYDVPFVCRRSYNSVFDGCLSKFVFCLIFCSGVRSVKKPASRVRASHVLNLAPNEVCVEKVVNV